MENCFRNTRKQRRKVLQMLQEKGFSKLELRKDMQGKDRMVKAVWKM